MLHSLLSGLLFILLMCQTITSTNSVENNCTASLSSDFTEDCNNGHLKNFSQCLRDTKMLSPMIISNELNTQYCKSGDCEFSCKGNSFTNFVSSATITIVIRLH